MADHQQTVLLMDGAMGTELIARGAANDQSLAWSATAISDHADVITAIHRDYVSSGATIHTANTFRTQRRTVGQQWSQWTRRAIGLARNAVPNDHRVAGSLPPLCDCYRPDLSPPDPRPEQREFANALHQFGCDLILCETHCHPSESLSAVEEAIRTGSETWLSLTAGPHADLLSESEMVDIALAAVDRGASAILVNCTPASQTLRFLQALVSADLKVPVGAYANAGVDEERCGWHSQSQHDTTRYAHHAMTWISAGATIIGGCCGIGPATIAELDTRLRKISQ
ncbi:homocysteine S-methyltransferase family protein [Stieleria varia]|uniref:Homocysteine S-methyltransferase n=1 Tax=Stieleria varia TaxID=2528005 RepID=A0A5C5ZRR3_9BACT|nr:homocysteine S-methyltransferase family protein [Stieleria varia]TWT89481.1 Homocysteine S-methyltransferase [Stieleria varia]